MGSKIATVMRSLRCHTTGGQCRKLARNSFWITQRVACTTPASAVFSSRFSLASHKGGERHLQVSLLRINGAVESMPREPAEQHDGSASFTRSPIASATNIATPRRENTVVHHRKIDRRMAAQGLGCPKTRRRVRPVERSCSAVRVFVACVVPVHLTSSSRGKRLPSVGGLSAFHTARVQRRK